MADWLEAAVAEAVEGPVGVAVDAIAEEIVDAVTEAAEGPVEDPVEAIVEAVVDAVAALPNPLLKMEIPTPPTELR